MGVSSCLKMNFRRPLSPKPAGAFPISVRDKSVLPVSCSALTVWSRLCLLSLAHTPHRFHQQIMEVLPSKHAGPSHLHRLVSLYILLIASWFYVTTFKTISLLRALRWRLTSLNESQKSPRSDPRGPWAGLLATAVPPPSPLPDRWAPASRASRPRPWSTLPPHGFPC